MAFPSTLDSLTNPGPTDNQQSLSHSAQHTAENNAIEALEAKVGIDASGDTASFDYKLSAVTWGAKAESSAQKGVANGYAGLDSTGKVPASQVPTYNPTPPSSPLSQGDVRSPAAGSSTAYDGANSKVVTTNADGSKVEYRADGIYWIDTVGNIQTYQAETFSSWDGSKYLYASGDFVLVPSGNYAIAAGAFAYINKPNEFTEAQIFDKDAIFKGRAVLPFYKNASFTGGTFTFDGNNGASQVLPYTAVSGFTLKAKNMIQGTYVLAIVNTWGSGTFTLPTGQTKQNVSNTNTLPDTSSANLITGFYQVGTVPANLATGVHIFTLTVFETGCHVAYFGQSVAL